MRFHSLPDNRRIAFRHTPGTGPAIIFLPGYMSDMAGSKATALFDWAVEQRRECLLLDYSGCGESTGDFADGTLSRWKDEVLALAAAHVVSRHILLVGSSMGGWLMLLVGEALEAAHPGRLAGMVGIAAAPDFTDWGYDDEEKALLSAGTTLLRPNPYGPEPTPTHAAFWADGEANRRLGSTIALTCPVHLLHGQADSEVPPQVSLALAESLAASDVCVTLVKGGDHRLSRPADISLLLRTVAATGAQLD